MRRLRLAAGPAITAVLLLAACGEDDGSATTAKGPTRTVEIVATEYAFAGDPGDAIVAGETIRFAVSNGGELIHEMQVLDGDGKLLDRTAEIPPGGRDEVTVTFEEPGVYQVICDVDDHLSRGQQARFDVAEP
ncbi:MAG: cupredoxin domain-containing protein [Ilumatobacteraceae bacterium]